MGRGRTREEAWPCPLSTRKSTFVENSPRADELLTVIHKEVEVVGWVRGIERGTPEIQLYEYRVIAASATA
jgi:hypothetical protein